MSDVTVVCCYNNKKMYDEFISTLKTQTVQCEIIGIDNTGNNRFSSCSSAYNSAINQIKTKYVIYSHQDILLNEPDTVEKFISYLERIKCDDILGVAGMKFYSNITLTNITHRDNKTGELVHLASFLSETSFFESGMTECDTLDECFFGGYTEHFRNYPFDEIVCNNWHLYAAEECLRTKSLNIGKVYACDVPLIHLSSGTRSVLFQYGFYRLCRKYSASFPFIRTTCAFSRTDFYHLFPRFLYVCCGAVLRRVGLYDAVIKFLP